MRDYDSDAKNRVGTSPKSGKYQEQIAGIGVLKFHAAGCVLTYPEGAECTCETKETVDALCTLLAEAEADLLERVRREVIGEDEDEDPKQQREGVNVGYDYTVANRAGANKLRRKQRTALNRLAKPADGDTEGEG